MNHEDLKNALGAHVLGQLHDPGLERLIEDHLPTCAACRAEVDDLAPLAGRLRTLDPALIAPLAVTPPPELDRRIDQIFADGSDEEATVTPMVATRRRRWVVALAGAVVGAAAATGVALVLHDPVPAGPTVIAVAEVGTAEGIEASAGLVDHSWGVEVKLQIDGLEAGERYDFQVVADDGTVRAAGQVLGVADTTVVCSMNSSILLADATSFDVVDESGAKIVWGEITS